jgi:hypothetical protein
LDDAREKLPSQTVSYSVAQDIEVARSLADELVRKLSEIEARMISRASSASVDSSQSATG